MTPAADRDGPAVRRAVEYLARRQQPSGQFQILVGLDLDEGVDDPSIFATCLIGQSLRWCTAPGAEPLRQRAADFVLAQKEGAGLWRHWTRGHPNYHMIPYDVDDAACASALLRQEGRPVPDNSGYILANRDPEGRFYSWIIARWPPPPPALWPFLRHRVRRPREARRFWTQTPSEPDDIDAVVNAHVLVYLGDGDHAPPVVSHLLGVLERREEPADKWYPSPRFFYYAVARASEAVPALNEARAAICSRIAAAAGPDGSLGGGPVETALALIALARWDAEPGLRERAAAYLERTQEGDGSWPVAPVYHGDTTLWGSRELSTGLCAEALARHALTAAA